jgi:hypothetical protein
MKYYVNEIIEEQIENSVLTYLKERDFRQTQISCSLANNHDCNNNNDSRIIPIKITTREVHRILVIEASIL